MKVTVHGPNGTWSRNDVTFHVHAAGCADTRKAMYRMSIETRGWEIEVASRDEVVEATYEPECFLYDPTDAADRAAYDEDFHFFPCTAGLPQHTPADAI